MSLHEPPFGIITAFSLRPHLSGLPTLASSRRMSSVKVLRQMLENEEDVDKQELSENPCRSSANRRGAAGESVFSTAGGDDCIWRNMWRNLPPIRHPHPSWKIQPWEPERGGGILTTCPVKVLDFKVDSRPHCSLSVLSPLTITTLQPAWSRLVNRDCRPKKSPGPERCTRIADGIGRYSQCAASSF